MVFVCVSAITMHTEEASARRPHGDNGNVQLAPEVVANVNRSQTTTAATLPSTFCTTGTLRGTYQYREEGYWDGLPYRSSGLETFDGQGNVVGMATDSDTPEGYRFTGTYEIDQNCHGKVNYSGGDSYAIYVAPNGSTIEFISTDFEAVLSGPSRRVSFGFLVQ
jgi:hypothetical protein